ncbi:hypothetical protein BD309DRAFT_869093 [Dichomitus squalens]|uniref:Uncharacterized protein n=1 Tax=Dichomitus squalens (strain LYAD-421) TaxID=732165 RepID=R7SLZ5_DICSQ|nr:uncharacterized protein DICSQDRAFT_141538 [Dichomitus squalens LYAD-421 SS1]EJF56057.1 hypothetical protein DICSQDRAFT_141538 [Dichomitus squalens LYAD-421 SS1]TBU41031.1 hypothetical protein BD309DRAFT_869093 [Dichomitus squalens]
MKNSRKMSLMTFTSYEGVQYFFILVALNVIQLGLTLSSNADLSAHVNTIAVSKHLYVLRSISRSIPWILPHRE